MGFQTWRETLFASIADVGPLTAAAEALIATDVTLPAGYMYAGRVLKATLHGRASNAVTTPGTLQIRSRWGGLAGTLLHDTGAMTQNVIVQTNKSWMAEFLFICRSVGTAGSILPTGWMTRGNRAAAAFTDPTVDQIPQTAPAAVSVDTTIAKVLSFTATPSLTTASITCHSYVLEALN